jgi:ABC-type Na+ efflux pump permease subunit
MKLLTIAIKDLTRSFRSTFALIFMFGVPLMVTGLFYFMFGSMNNQDSGFNLPPTKVVVVNLDEGHPQVGQLGEMVVETLQSADFASLMEVSLAADAAAARQMVASQQAGVAIIVPKDFSASFTDSNAIAEIELYKDPTLTIGPGVVQAVLNQFTDGLAGVKITVALALQQAEAGKIEYAQINQIIADYQAAVQASTDSQSLIEPRSPAAPAKNFLLTMIGSIMGGMMIFYAFFTGVNSPNSILRKMKKARSAASSPPPPHRLKCWAENSWRLASPCWCRWSPCSLLPA